MIRQFLCMAGLLTVAIVSRGEDAAGVERPSLRITVAAYDKPDSGGTTDVRLESIDGVWAVLTPVSLPFATVNKVVVEGPKQGRGHRDMRVEFQGTGPATGRKPLSGRSNDFQRRRARALAQLACRTRSSSQQADPDGIADRHAESRQSSELSHSRNGGPANANGQGATPEDEAHRTSALCVVAFGHRRCNDPP